MKLTDINTTEQRLLLLDEVAQNFSARASEHDENGTFPFENMNDLKAINYPALAIPKQYGGLGISVVEMLKMQEIIASYDGSTALSIGWHLGITKHLGETMCWEESVFTKVAKDVVENGALLNNAATEPATGSPTRGGKPTTTAKKSASGWKLNGRKSFTTLSPVLDYFVVSASIAGTDEVGNFLVRRDLPGVTIEETWDSIAMKATGSNDLVLTDVSVRKEDYVQTIIPGKKPAQGWLLHIPACYLGIAKAAQRYAVAFATTYAPNNMKGTISDFPTVRQKIGEIELHMFEASTLLYAVAEKWDQSAEHVRQTMQTALSVAKVSVVNHALQVVDLAMRIVGARSLSAKCPLQRYYRDVRAGLHNPPMDDMVIMALAEASIHRDGEKQ